MTIREAFNTILDGSFTTIINGVSYQTADSIPEDVLNAHIRVVRPYCGRYDGFYKIIIDDTKPVVNGNLKMTKATGYKRTDYWFCVTPGVVNRTVYEKNGEYFIQYDNKITKVDINRCHRK